MLSIDKSCRSKSWFHAFSIFLHIELFPKSWVLLLRLILKMLSRYFPLKTRLQELLQFKRTNIHCSIFLKIRSKFAFTWFYQGVREAYLKILTALLKQNQKGNDNKHSQLYLEECLGGLEVCVMRLDLCQERCRGV